MNRLVFRPAESPDDWKFCAETFLDSYKDSNHAGVIPRSQWHQVMRPVVHSILERPDVETYVAAFDKAKPGLADLAGWVAVHRGFLIPKTVQRDGRHCQRLVVSKEPLVFYAYVLRPYRKEGIAGRLLATAGVDYRQHFYHSTKTRVLKKLERSAPHMTWAPRTLRYQPRRDNGESGGSENGE